MRSLPLLLGLVLASGPALADLPFAKGDPKAGHALHNKACVACHDNSVYTRADRKLKSAAQLAGRVAGCNANTGAGLFPEDEANIAAYLNQQYYHFKK